MNVRSLIVTALVAVIACFTAACGGSSEKLDPTPPKAAPATAQPVDPSPPSAYYARVDLHGFSDEDQWLPVQFDAMVVPHQTVSLRETWPRHGDRVRVLCIKQGGTFRDLSGLEVDTWYGIFVPADKASPEAHDGIQPEAERMPRNTGFRAYVGASWLNVDEGLQAPAC